MADIVQDDPLEASMKSEHAGIGDREDTTTTPEEQHSTKDAGTRLTNTYELLEQILLDNDLPMETVFFAQRVNKQFRSLIRRSKGLQQKLFLQPIDFPINPAFRKYVPLDGEVRLNPLFTRKAVYENLPLFFTNSVTELTTTHNDADTFHLKIKKPTISVNDWSVHDHKMVLLDMRYETQIGVPRTLEMTGEESSWMQMYMTQPPIQARCEVGWDDGWPQDYHATYTRENRTIGQMIQAVCGDFKDWDCSTP
ncbi:hypothetical protein LTS10_005154 [Elasticomyces elasticus]|nr:hypothetical protein LTS10_005154 [Elasticomyces elasticus]